MTKSAATSLSVNYPTADPYFHKLLGKIDNFLEAIEPIQASHIQAKNYASITYNQAIIDVTVELKQYLLFTTLADQPQSRLSQSNEETLPPFDEDASNRSVTHIDAQTQPADINPTSDEIDQNESDHFVDALDTPTEPNNNESFGETVGEPQATDDNSEILQINQAGSEASLEAQESESDSTEFHTPINEPTDSAISDQSVSSFEIVLSDTLEPANQDTLDLPDADSSIIEITLTPTVTHHQQKDATPSPQSVIQSKKKRMADTVRKNSEAAHNAIQQDNQLQIHQNQLTIKAITNMKKLHFRDMGSATAFTQSYEEIKAAISDTPDGLTKSLASAAKNLLTKAANVHTLIFNVKSPNKKSPPKETPVNFLHFVLSKLIEEFSQNQNRDKLNNFLSILQQRAREPATLNTIKTAISSLAKTKEGRADN